MWAVTFVHVKDSRFICLGFESGCPQSVIIQFTCVFSRRTRNAKNATIESRCGSSSIGLLLHLGIASNYGVAVKREDLSVAICIVNLMLCEMSV